MNNLQKESAKALLISEERAEELLDILEESMSEESLSLKETIKFVREQLRFPPLLEEEQDYIMIVLGAFLQAYS